MAGYQTRKTTADATVAAYKAATVTPSDSADLPQGTTRGIYVGGAGNIAATMNDGTAVTFTGMLGGVIYPLQIDRIASTNTTATNIVALY